MDPMSQKPLNRKSLKSLFREGSRPNESNFGSLIDSMMNRVDDGISKDVEDGLILAPEGKESKRVISFFENIQDESPKWGFNLVGDNTPGIGILETITSAKAETRMFFAQGGNIGIHTDTPRTVLDVQGTFGSSQRMGTHIVATAPADGNWHTIVSDLDGCIGYEIVAQAGKPKTGRHALMHAFALSTFGKSRSKIRTTQAHYGWWWNKLKIRWKGTTYNYSLQIKSRSDYGENQEIRFHITKIWDNDIMQIIAPK
jgi:hypothetical protein